MGTHPNSGYTNDIQTGAAGGHLRGIYETLELLRKSSGSQSMFVIQIG